MRRGLKWVERPNSFRWTTPIRRFPDEEGTEIIAGCASAKTARANDQKIPR